MSEKSPEKKMISHCQKVYTFLAEMGDTANQELENIERLKDMTYKDILNRFLKTRENIQNIIAQLTEYSQDSVDIKNVCGNEETEQKKEPLRKRKNFSLKKEKDEELTQDELLEIYKIDMTEDPNEPCVHAADTNENQTPSNHDDDSDGNSQAKSNSTGEASNKGDDSSAELTDNLLEDDEVEALRNIGCDSSDTDIDSTASLYSMETFVLDNNENRKDEDINADEASDLGDDDAVSKQIKTETEEIEDGAVKNCSIVLNDCTKEVQNGHSSQDEDVREILKLLNLNNVDRKRKSSESSQPKKKFKSKLSRESKNRATHSSASDDVTDSPEEGNVEAPNIEEASAPLNDRDSLLKVIMECMSDPAEILEDYDDSDSSTDVEKGKKKIKDKATRKSNNEGSDDPKYISEEHVEISEDEKKKNKRKKWRQDKLLTGKLPDDSSDEEKENDPEQRHKPKRRRKPRRKSEAKDSNIDEKSSTADVDSTDSDFDNLSVVCLSNPSDSSSSDIEFIKTVMDENRQETASEVATGRRNIRTVQSFAQLAATTKKAQMEEEERHERLLSQSQLLLEVSDESGLVLDIDKETKRPLVVVDEKITARMKEHQKEGVRFMWNICFEGLKAMKTSPGSGCILAHCMGLGKSFQVAALIHTLFSNEDIDTRRILIVCPLSTVSNWANEFNICHDVAKNKVEIKRWLLIDGKDKSKKYKIVNDWYQRKGVLILGYESFQSLLNVSKSSKVISVPKKVVEALLDPGPDLVICDEGHLIKNGKINRTKTLSRIRSKRRIILTGTPMQNNLTEYFYMVDFVKPSLLGTKREFSNQFINPIVNGGYEDSTEGDIKLMRHRSHVLHELLKDTVQRYEISELLRYLPKKLDYVIFIPLQPLQIELYKAYMATIPTAHERKKWFFNDYNRLRSIWTHPSILALNAMNTKRKEVDTITAEPEVQEETPNEWWQSRYPADILTNIQYGPKMKVMLEIIRESMRLNEKVLIFGSNLVEMDAIEMFLNDHGYEKKTSYLRMDGTVPPHERTDYCKKFNRENSNIKIFLLSQRVGGLGLNLVAANRIILMGVNFNPAVDNQSIFRAYRFGQEKSVYVYRLVSIGTMEEVIYERSITKQATSLRVVDEHQISRHYTSNDLAALYRFRSYADAPRHIPKRPVDDVLAAILDRCEKDIFKYQCHQDLLENRPEEQLNEEEQRLAWEEFRKLQQSQYQDPSNPNTRVQNDSNVNGPVETAATPLQSNPPNHVFNPEIVSRNNNVQLPTLTAENLRAHLMSNNNNNNTRASRLTFVPRLIQGWQMRRGAALLPIPRPTRGGINMPPANIRRQRSLQPNMAPINRMAVPTVVLDPENAPRSSSNQRPQGRRYSVIRNPVAQPAAINVPISSEVVELE